MQSGPYSPTAAASRENTTNGFNPATNAGVPSAGTLSISTGGSIAVGAAPPGIPIPPFTVAMPPEGTFSRWAAGFRKDLLPIVPPGAELTQHSATIAEQDARLIANGYEPVATVGKRPLNNNWQMRPNTIEAITADRQAMPSANNTGLRTGRLVGVDIDVEPAAEMPPGYIGDNPDHTPQIIELVNRVLGENCMVRVGSKGAMLVYRNATPASKIVIVGDHPVFKKPAGRNRQPGHVIGTSAERFPKRRPHQIKVEILGQGQQFVAYGIHPDTDRPYAWLTGATPTAEPLQRKFDELPEVTPDMLCEFAQSCKALFEQLGYVNVRVTSAGEYAGAREVKRRQERTPVPREYLIEMLKCIEASRYDGNRNGWIGILGAIQATNLRDVDPQEMDTVLVEIANEWSSGGASYEGRDDVEHVYYSLSPEKEGGTTFGTLYKLANEGGWDKPAPLRMASEWLSPAERKAVNATKARLDAAQAAAGVLPARRVLLRRGGSYKLRDIEWLWPGWLARGKFHVLAGRKGAGKSSLVFSLIAQITIGGVMPDGTIVAPGDVLIWSGEDDPDDTILPRIAAAGGDVNRVLIPEKVFSGGAAVTFDPALHMTALAEHVDEAHNLSLIMIDSIVSASAADSHKNAETRRGLQPTVDLAVQTRAALVGITHFTKNTQGNNPVERVAGSLAYGALPRMVLGAVAGDDDNASRRLIRLASNIGQSGGGFEYNLNQAPVPNAGFSAQRVEWGNALNGTPSKLLEELENGGEKSELQKAMSFLRNLLGFDKTMPVQEVKHAAEAHGITWRTLQRAKMKMSDIEAVQGEGGKQYLWRANPFKAAKQ
jgi:putative DNA primase/helicase